ncbi:MAG TPA: outer membrane beta-barrel protein [Steroidobacteraceae bacterium]
MRKFVVLLALALGAGAAHADNGLLYVGAGVSNDNLKDITATNSSLNSTNWKVWAGVRPISLFAVEADYIDLGSQSATSMFVTGTSSTHVNYKAFTGYAVGYVPIPLPYLDVFGKAGLARWTASGGSSISFGPLPASFFSLSDHGTQFAWGAGGQVHIGNFGARLEYENFSVRNTNGANLVSLSVFFNLF